MKIKRDLFLLLFLFCESCSFCHVNIVIFGVFYLYIFNKYDWITIMGYSKQKFSTIRSP